MSFSLPSTPGRAPRGRSENQRPPFPREFQGSTSDNCHAERFSHEEKLFGIVERPSVIEEKLRGIVEKLFVIDAARFSHEEKLSGIEEKLSGIDAALFSHDTQRLLIDAAFLFLARFAQHAGCAERVAKKQRSKEAEKMKKAKRRKTRRTQSRRARGELMRRRDAF